MQTRIDAPEIIASDVEIVTDALIHIGKAVVRKLGQRIAIGFDDLNRLVEPLVKCGFGHFSGAANRDKPCNRLSL